MVTTTVRAGRAAPRRARGGRNVPRFATILLALVVAAALAVAGWGLRAASISGGYRVPASMGEAVRVSGGTLRVDRIIPENMAPLHSDKFAHSGMSMSGMGMDMAPKGQRRFSVEITLIATGAGGLHYSASQFRVTGKDMEPTGPHRQQLGDGRLARGSAVSSTLTFQAPENASQLVLRYGADARPIALALDDGHHEHDSSGDHEHPGGDKSPATSP